MSNQKISTESKQHLSSIFLFKIIFRPIPFVKENIAILQFDFLLLYFIMKNFEECNHSSL